MSETYGSKGANSTTTEHHRKSITRDEQTLENLGKAPVLKRNFTFLSMLGFSSTVMLTWEGVLGLLDINLANGGLAGSVYGFLFVWIGTTSAFSTMAELASMAPTAGGQYHWVAVLAPPRLRVILSYLVGWLTFIGWQSVVASGAFITAQLTQGLVIISHETYTVEPWRTLLIFWAIILFSVFINTVVAQLLPKLESLILILHSLGFVAIIIPMIYFGPHGDAASVFTTFANESGWSTQGLSFMVGLIGPMFSLAGPDSVVHMSEEIFGAERNVPWAILSSTVINGLLGFGMLIATLFCLGDLETVSASPTGYVFMGIFVQAVDSVAGASIMVLIVVLMFYAATLSFVTSASRVTWSFARDCGIPGWQLFKRVEQRTTLPLWSIGLTCTISVLLSLIVLGSSLAFNDVISLTLAGLYMSYLIGNSLLLWRRLQGKIQPYSPGSTGLRNTINADNITWGPWKIPEPWDTINNIFGCLYLIVTLFFSFWPTAANPNAAGMNYSSLLLGATLLFSGAYYLVHGRKTFNGPVVEIVS